MNSPIDKPTPAEYASANSAWSRQIGYGAAALAGTCGAMAIASSAAIAEPTLEPNSAIVYKAQLEQAQLEESQLEQTQLEQAQLEQAQIQQVEPSAADLMRQGHPIDSLLSSPSAEVYPVVVDPALAAALSNGELASELTDETATFPLLLTQIEEDTTELRPEFGEKGQTRWFLQAGAGTEGDGESLALFGGGASYFFAKGHSISLALNGMAFDLPDKDPVGINLDLLVRSHWIRGDNWSLYIDGGVGILVSTSRVPNGGSSFNFTPQGGVGASINVNRKRDHRLLIGARWHHISNANTFEANPGLDTYMGYVGMTFPIR